MAVLTTSHVRTTLVALGLTLALNPAFAQMAHDHGEHAESMQMEEHHDMAGDEDPGKARCAFDGALMKRSAMVERTVDGMPFYFCNQKEGDTFPEDPLRYRSQIRLGHLRLNVNVLTANEYIDVMNDMGMGGMMDVPPIEGRSHRIAVYLTQHGQDIELDDVNLSLRLSRPSGGSKIIPLKFNKMMKTFDAALDLEAHKEQQIGVLIATPTVDVSI